MDASSTINKEVVDYQSLPITIVPGFTFSQFETIKNIFFYYNSKFVSGDTDDDGDRKYFYNINRNPCMVFTKGVDFDTKNIKLLTVEGGNSLKTWFMERDLKYWMRDKQFGKVLNRIFTELPIFGTVVLKVVEGTPYFIDLRNFIVEQGADSLPESNYIIEIHNMTPGELRKQGKKMGWKQSDINETIDQFHKMKDTSHIRLYERYGELKDIKTGKWAYKRVFYADVQYDYLDQQNKLIRVPGIELSSEDWNEEDVAKMYWEFHMDKISGRWLGRGVVENLFEPQIKQNEIANLQGKSAYWKAMMFFQTRDGSFNRNLSIDVQNGEVLTSDSEITQVNTEDRNLSFFVEETQKWMKNRDELTNAFAPAGQTRIAIQVAQQQVAAYFHQIQQNVALDIKEMLYEVIIPQFAKENKAEHYLRLAGEDLDKFIEMIKDDLVFKEIIRQVVAGAPFPTEDDKKMIELAVTASIKQKKEHQLNIPKGFFDDVKYDVDIDITGESVDVKERYATYMAILQAITADPTMLTDPTKKKILFGMAEDGGISPSDFFDAKPVMQDPTIPQKGAGGGVSAPIASPLSMDKTTTV